LLDPVPLAFDRDIYGKYEIAGKFKHLKIAIRSIINTISPTSEYFSKIDLSYIDNLRIEISEYYKLFDAVVGAFPEYPLCDEEIEFIGHNCRDTSRVHGELENALRWLLVARDALATTQEQKKNSGRFDTRLQEEYYRCLQVDCRNALVIVLENFKDGTETK
jgi:hypothetical protein